jgi:hypothetical protein
MKLLLKAETQKVNDKDGKYLEGLWALKVLSCEPSAESKGRPLERFVLEQELLPSDVKKGDDIVITIERAT